MEIGYDYNRVESLFEAEVGRPTRGKREMDKERESEREGEPKDNIDHREVYKEYEYKPPHTINTMVGYSLEVHDIMADGNVTRSTQRDLIFTSQSIGLPNMSLEML